MSRPRTVWTDALREQIANLDDNGMTMREIGARVGKTAAAVNGELHRMARAKLIAPRPKRQRKLARVKRKYAGAKQQREAAARGLREAIAGAVAEQGTAPVFRMSSAEIDKFLGKQ
jgi:IS30 family transposase